MHWIKSSEVTVYEEKHPVDLREADDLFMHLLKDLGHHTLSRLTGFHKKIPDSLAELFGDKFGAKMYKHCKGKGEEMKLCKSFDKLVDVFKLSKVLG